jgi:hypothetical protein
MSHFCVLVIGDDVEEQLRPYQENNMGDCPGEYMEFKEADLEDLGDNPEDSGYEQLPETGKWGYWHNPNAKWDWYEVGGRWTGYLPLKDGYTGIVGQPGLMTDPAEEGYADSVPLKAVDFDRAKADKRKQANELFDTWEAATEKHGFPRSFAQVKSDCGNDIDKARETYHAQGAIQATREHFFWDCPVESLGHSRAAYVAKCEDQALVPFAILKDGKWYERGSMGWWGCVSDEKDKSTWNREFHNLMTDLPPDTQLTIVDCHI